MPVSAETLRNIPRLNLVFALSSLAAFGSFLWMMYDDHERKWRGHQRAYFDALAALAHFDLLELESDEAKARRSAAEQRVKQEEQKLTKNQERIKELKAREAEQAGLLQGAALSFGNLNATHQVTIFHYEEHKTIDGEAAAATKQWRKAVETEREALDALRVKKEKIEDTLAAVRRELKQIQAPVELARRELGVFDKAVDDARKREKMYRAGVATFRTALNLPGLDFVAPKGTMGREEIKQVVLPEVRQEYNFVQSYTIDRCTTCHIAIDKPEASMDALVARAETALKNVNAKRVSAGQPPLAVPTNALKEPADSHGDDAAKHGRGDAVADEPERPAGEGEKAAEAWPAYADMTAAQRTRYARALAATVNEHLKAEGLAPLRIEQPLLAHPNLELFVAPDSPHGMSAVGCTSCHEGNGQETDFVYAAHTPANHAQHHEWEKKYYDPVLGIPKGTFELIEEFWDRPMVHPRYAQATCSKCHTEIADLASYRGDGAAEKLTQGRKLFTQVGCINCHLVEGLGDSRRVGPDLTAVNQKLTQGFMERWIEYPAEFRPSTLMPHFFKQENNLPSSGSDVDPNPKVRTETEIAAISHYLRTFSRPYAAEAVPEGIEGDAKRGHELFVNTGCLACHGALGAVDPKDEKGRTFGQKWVTRDLVKREGMAADKAAERVAGMSLNDLSHYAIEHFTEERHEAAKRELEQLRSRGEDTAELYVPPFFTRFAPDLSGIGSKLVPSASDPADAKRGREWLYNWLREPKHYHTGTKMPRLFGENYYWREPDPVKRRALADRDLLDLTAYLLSLRNDGFRQEPIPDDDAHRKMTTDLIRSLLAGQYSDAAADMLIGDLKEAEDAPLGPLTDAILKQIEPSLGRDAALARISAQDLAGRQKLYLGVRMITHYGCYACHTIAGYETASRPGTELTFWGEKRLPQLDFAFFSPGFEELREQDGGQFTHLYPESAEYEPLVRGNGNESIEVMHTRAAFAYHKMRNPRIWDRGKIKKPYEKLKMPNFFLAQEEADALVTFLLSRTHPLVTNNVQVDYQGTATGGIARGRHLVEELNCIGCHRIEDNEPTLHQYSIIDDPSGGIMVDELNLPPWLHGEGAKVNHGWFHVFLRNVEMLRPWLNVRMPSFHLDDTEATALVEYFASVSRDEAADVAKRLARVHEFVGKAQKAAAGEPASTQPSERTPGDNWFADPTLARIKDWLADYAMRYRLVRPAAVDANDNDEAGLAAGFARVKQTAEFVGSLYDIPYPFAESPRPSLSAEQFGKGEAMLLEMKCLACHVLGDVHAKGANANPSAPNLSLTARRLQRKWLRSWLQYPALIQPGTKMPQWWGDGGSLASYPEADYKAFAEKYGETHETQMALLEDYLIEAGNRNHTVIDPTAAAAPPPAAEGEGEIDLDDAGGDSGDGAKQEEGEIDLDE